MKTHTRLPIFLMDGARFKLSFNSIECDECGAEHDKVSVEPLGMYSNELQGKWVALVPAENDKHLELINIIEQRDELLAALVECDEAMSYMSEYDIPIMLPQRVKDAIASVKGGAA